MRKKILTATLILATMVLPLLPDKHAEAAKSYYEGFKMCFIPGSNNIYLRGKFTSTPTTRFHAHFTVTINEQIDYTHKICSGYTTYYINSTIFSLYQPFKASGYTTK